MKSSNRVFFDWKSGKSSGRLNRVSKLSSLSDESLWRLRESIGLQIIEALATMIKVPLYHWDRLKSLESLIKGLEKRYDDLSRELDFRLQSDIDACEQYGPAYQNRAIQPHFTQNGVIVILDPLVEETKTRQKSKRDCKVPNTPFNGFSKRGFDKKVPNPKNKIWMDRSKIRIGR